MELRHALLPVALAVLLVGAGCLGAVTAATPAADDGTVSVTGAGQVTAEADLAVVRLAAVGTGDDAATAREAVAADVAAIRAALADAGVADDAVTTAYYRLAAEHDRDREVRGYRATHALRVEVAPDGAGAVVDAAVAAGAARVDGVHFTLSDATRADLRAEAIEAAVADARADADALAAAAGVSVTGVSSLSTAGFGPVPYRAEGAADGAGTPTTFSPGPVTVTATVSATYTLG